MAIGERIEQHPRNTVKAALIAAAGVTGITALVAGGAILLSRDRGPQNPPTEPVKASDPFKPAEPASAGLPTGIKLSDEESTPTAVPTATEIPATATPEPTPTREVKPIPDIITLASLEQAGRGIVVWTPEQIEAARAEAAQRGEIKFPLPKIVFDLGGKFQSPTTKDGLVITDIDPTIKDVEFPALIKGVALKTGPANKRANVVTIQSTDKLNYNLIFPLTGSTILTQVGREVNADQSIFSTRFDNTFSQGFPLWSMPNKFAAISISNPDGSLAKIDQTNILTDEKGNIVVVGSPALSMGKLNADVNPNLVAAMSKGDFSSYSSCPVTLFSLL